ncbi:MAG TPA: GNAT family N-acetyltransferase, partial [Bdellovibrionota bacterium]|nr:GNAT family N-acetyltransferase [Bdellovibrionota bacterium]
MAEKTGIFSGEFREVTADAAGPLLDRCFPVRPGFHFFDDFPVWGPLGPKGAKKLFGWSPSPGAAPAACAGARIAELRLAAGQKTLRTGIVGAVATDPQYRGRGLASAAVESALRWLDAEGCALTLLWGSEHDLYRRFGFELCGEQGRTLLAALKTKEEPGWKIAEGWQPTIWNLSTRRSLGLALRPEDEGWYSGHRGTRWFVATGPRGAHSFAALGRGMDLSGYVHEWGGADAGVRAIFAEIARLEGDAQILYRPGGLRDLGLGEPAGAAREFLCMARISDPAGVAAVLGGPVQRLGFEISASGYWKVTWGGSAIGEVPTTELARLFFGPAPAIEEAQL